MRARARQRRETMAPKLADDERAAITEAIRAGGSRAEVARRFGRSPDTVGRIAQAEGLSFDRSATQVATEARRADNAAKRAELISGMYDDARRLRRQMFAPAVERKAMVVSDGSEMGSHVEIVDIELEQPTFGDKRNIAVSVKVLADGAKGLEAVDESGGVEAKGMLVRLVDGIRAGDAT